jgi:hypothetical protein
MARPRFDSGRGAGGSHSIPRTRGSHKDISGM